MTEAKTSPPAGKAPRESFVEKTEIVLPSDANNLGTVFGGRIMAWLDVTAAIAAGRHCRTTVVTASMDDLHFMAPIASGHVVVLRGQVVFAGRTSVEVEVKVDSEHPHTGELRRCCQAFLTFVALDEQGRPTAVPALLTETPDDEKRYMEAQERRLRRLERHRTRDEGTQ